MKSWRIIAVLPLLLILVGSIACNPFGDEESEVEQQLVEVVRGDLTVSVSGSGNIEVANEAKLSFSSGGRIDRIYVEEGDEVSEGNVLAKLDTSALELALTQAIVAQAQAEVARDDAEYNLNQLKNVLHASYDRVKVAESQLESAELQAEATEQAVAEAQKQLDEATISAPFDSVVARVAVDEKDTVSSATTIIHLIDLTTMELKVEVDEIDIPDVRLNQKAVIEVDALPALQVEGKVISISPLSTEEGGVVVYEVKIGVDVPEGSDLKVGMSATADIIVHERSNVLLAPTRAVGEDSHGKPMVKVMVNEQIEERPVVIGISDGFQTEIVDGLNEGEVVVVERRAR